MQIKVGATLYPFPNEPLELGDQRRMKREYGFIAGKDELDLDDPDHVAAFVYAAMRIANPDEPGDRLVSRINRVKEINILGDDGQPLTEENADVPGADPTPAAPSDDDALT